MRLNYVDEMVCDERWLDVWDNQKLWMKNLENPDEKCNCNVQ